MKNIKIILIPIALICIIAIIWFGINFAPGSYSQTKKYRFNIPEKELIMCIEKLKSIDTSLKVPEDYGMVEGRKSKDDYWYHFYLFYSDSQEVLNCWVRANSIKSTDLAFVSIRDKFGKWKSIDRDFDRLKAQEQQKKFENRILDKLKRITNKIENN